MCTGVTGPRQQHVRLDEHRSGAAPFLDANPCHLHSRLERLLTRVFPHSACRAHASPPEYPKQSTDMINVIPDSEFAAHEIGHAWTRPERRGESRGLGATQQQPLQPSALSSIQLRGSARHRLGVDSGGPRPMVAGAPAPNRPAIHADAARDFHGRHPLSEEGDGAMSTTRKRDRGSRWAQWCPSCIQDRTLLMQDSTPLGDRDPECATPEQLRNKAKWRSASHTHHAPVGVRENGRRDHQSGSPRLCGIHDDEICSIGHRHPR